MIEAIGVQTLQTTISLGEHGSKMIASYSLIIHTQVIVNLLHILDRANLDCGKAPSLRWRKFEYSAVDVARLYTHLSYYF